MWEGVGGLCLSFLRLGSVMSAPGICHGGEGVSMGSCKPTAKSPAQGDTGLLLRSHKPTCKGLGSSLPGSQEEVHEAGAPRWGPSVWGQVTFTSYWCWSILALENKPYLGSIGVAKITLEFWHQYVSVISLNCPHLGLVTRLYSTRKMSWEAFPFCSQGRLCKTEATCFT